VAKEQRSSVVVGFCFFGLLGSLFAWAVLRVFGFFGSCFFDLIFFLPLIFFFFWCPCVYF
jgi:hypothetical protein